MTNILRRLLCPHHEYYLDFVRNIYGDEIIHSGGKRSVWKCRECGAHVYKDELNRAAEDARRPLGCGSITSRYALLVSCWRCAANANRAGLSYIINRGWLCAECQAMFYHLELAEVAERAARPTDVERRVEEWAATLFEAKGR